MYNAFHDKASKNTYENTNSDMQYEHFELNTNFTITSVQSALC